MLVAFQENLPEEIAETQDKDTDSRELDDVCKGGMEFFDKIPEHRCQCQWAKPLREGREQNTEDGRSLPHRRPILSPDDIVSKRMKKRGLPW